MQKNNKIYPFFLIVDDGGFDFLFPEKNQGRIDMEIYYNILKIAKKFNIRIPICFTAKYLDKENISGVGRSLEYLDELMRFLKDNSKYIEMGYHGLVHEHEGHTGEFSCLDVNKPVPEDIQRNYMEKSQKIFELWGLKFPELFVPPYHAWEKGVTDKILKEYGVKYIVSQPSLKFNGYIYQWEKSDYLQFYPRASLGIYGNDCNLNIKMFKGVGLGAKMRLLEFVQKNIIPQGPVTNIFVRHTLSNKPVHSYMTHIGNFSGQSLDFWYDLFDYAANNKNLHLCRSNEEAVKFYNNLVT